jgi:hypothetical protein
MARAAQSAPIVILVSPIRTSPGRFQAGLESTDELLVGFSRQPFVDAARVLVGKGYNPASVLEMKHQAPTGKRRAIGNKKTRAEYLAGSLSRMKPWEAEGISRRTWERRRKVAAATAPVASPCTANLPLGWERTCDISTSGPSRGGADDSNVVMPVPTIGPAGAQSLEGGRHPEDTKSQKNIFPGAVSQKVEEGEESNGSVVGTLETVPSRTSLVGGQGASTLDKLWKRYCAARRGVLPDGWATSCQIAVDEEGRAVTQFRRRRAETLRVMAKAKAAMEALLAKHLTPAEREAEKLARWAVLKVREDDHERRKFVINAHDESRRLRRELEARKVTPDEVERGAARARGGIVHRAGAARLRPPFGRQHRRGGQAEGP